MQVKTKRILLAVMVFIAVLGFSTGINYQKLSGTGIIENAKGCFEFGFLQLLQNEKYKDSVINVLLSMLKHCTVFLLGTVSWLTFPLVPFNLFCIGFKMGVSASYVVTCMGINGILESIAFVLTAVIILLAATLLSYNVLEIRLLHSYAPGFSYNDKLFAIRCLIGALVLLAVLLLYHGSYCLINGRLKGIINSFL